MQPNPVSSELELCDLLLEVHLGCTSEEREKLQPISLSVRFGFLEPPPGEATDQLADTVCYSEVADSLSNLLSDKSYQLVEAMATDCLNHLKRSYPHVLIHLCLHKLNPPISYQTGGVKYRCGDYFA